MSTPRRGLGRGLAALLGESAVPVSSSQDVVREIPLSEITPNPFQPRKRFDGPALDELKASITEYGVLVPVIVRRRGNGYELIAGERRWRASAALQRASIPAIVRSSDDRQTLEFAIVENLQREDLNALEEAAGFQYLIDEHGLTQEDVARRLGKSRPAIANTLPAARTARTIKAMLATRGFPPVTGARFSPRRIRARSAGGARRERGLDGSRALQRLAGAAGDSRPKAKPARLLSADEHDFESRLRERFGTAVALVRNRRGGRVEFRFQNDDELLRLGDLLLPKEP